MSRPYQFSDPDNVSSPLDRRPQQQYPPGQAPSFKQNVNRAKTKKWVEAKSYSYEGDDWGDYDEDDEYGVDSAPRPAPSGMRSVTSPLTAPTSSQVLRKAPSFDRGDERRAFSTGAPTTLRSPVDNARQVSNTSFALSQASDLSSADPRHRADYSPTAEPPPLQSRTAPTSVPAREKPLPIVPPTALATEPIEMEDTSPVGPPIIRPADIYARMQAEREKERATPPIVGEQLKPTVYDSSTDATLSSEHEPSSLTETALSNEDRPRAKRIDSTPPQLNIASFGGDSPWGGDDFWGAGNKSARGSASAASPAVPVVASVSKSAVPSALQQQSGLQHAPSNGMRTMVGRAFEEPVRSSAGVHKQDSTRSNATDSTLSPSETDVSSDISPIMSRTTGVDGPSLHDTTPVHITERSQHAPAEFTRLSDSTLRAPTLVHDAPPRAPFASEERRRSLDTSPPRSPARAPVVTQPSRLSRSEAAEFAVTSPTVPSPTDRAMREADLAAAAMTLPVTAASAIAASEHEAQQTFLDRQPALPSERSPRISRAESPTKGRVADLTNRFSGDGRRGSQDSHRSSASFDRTLAPNSSGSPVRGAAASSALLNTPSQGVATGRDGALRPKMPGGWDSFATTTTEAPSDRHIESRHETILDDEHDDEAVTPIAAVPVAHQSGLHSVIPETPAFTPAATVPRQSEFFQHAKSPAAADVDLAPTTEIHQLPAREVRRSPPPVDHSIGAMAALTAAGAGLAGAFGSDGSQYQGRRHEQGDVIQRPYYNRFDSDITETTAADTVPPTPLARDNPLESRSTVTHATSTATPRVNPLGPTSAARAAPSSTTTSSSTGPRHDHLESASVVAPAAAALSAAALAHHDRNEPDPIETRGAHSLTSPTRSPIADEVGASPTRSRAAPVIASVNATRAPQDETASPTFAKTVAPVAPLLASSHTTDEEPLDSATARAAAPIAPILAASHASRGSLIEAQSPVDTAPVVARNSAGTALIGPDHERLSPTRPPVITKMSVDDSPTDLESDRLRKEIVRSLSPIDPPAVVHEPETIGTHFDDLNSSRARPASSARPFSVLPKEYDYYFSDTEETPEVPEIPAANRSSLGATPSRDAATVIGHHEVPTVTEPHQVSPLLPATTAVDPEDHAPSSIGRRFSWEASSENQSLISPVSPPQEPHPIPATTVPVADAKATSAAPTTTSAAKSTLKTRDIVDHPRLSGEGLHVINAEPHELHELPDTPVEHAQSAAIPAPVSPTVAENRAASVGSATTPTMHNEMSAPAVTLAPPTSRPAGSAALPYEPKLPSFREIMTIKSPEQRISTIIDTRKQWAAHDTGLAGWLNRTFDSLPQHQHLRSSNAQASAYNPIDTSSPRHRTTPSIGRVFSRTSMDGGSGSPANFQRSSAGPSPAGQRTSGAGAKGKELLSAAGVLGGKGVSGAKGLFAKGRLKLKGAGGGERGDD